MVGMCSTSGRRLQQTFNGRDALLDALPCDPRQDDRWLSLNEAVIFSAEGATGLKPKFGLVLVLRPSSSISWRFLQRKEPDCPAIILFRYSDAEPKAEDENDDEDEDDLGRKEASSESHTVKIICLLQFTSMLYLLNGAPF